MNELLGIIRNVGATRLAAIMGVATGVAIALALIVARISEAPMTVLYASLDPRDAQTVIERLEQQDIRYETRDDARGVTILAERDQAARVRIDMAADGVVRGGGVGYELFDETDAFGATSFQQNINRLRALEGELARTITNIAGVRTARVHLVLPERELFSRDESAASASIVVDAPSGLDARSVRAIVNLAASAVPSLSPRQVTVLDTSGELLASGKSEDEAFDLAGEERTAATEARLRRTVESIVGRIVGADNMRVQVAAELDFNRVTENSETIDPDSQTVLSSVIVEEDANTVDPATGAGVTVANALPGAQIAETDTPLARSSNRRTEETTNYEISRTVRSEVKELGGVKRLSVAVAINNTDAAGAPIERTPEELARIDTLVKSAIGFDAARGDTVEVVSVGFSAPAAAAPTATGSASPAIAREDVMRLLEIAALGLVALALVFFVLRPMLAPGAGAPAVAQATNAALPAAALAAERLAPPEDDFEQKIDLSRVEGQVRASSIKKVSEVVKGHTDESIGILKSWIRQAS